MAKNILFSAKNIKKSFGTNAVLKDISMDVAEGETVAILGPSGSGKTTFLRISTMLEKADYGVIEFAGRSAMVSRPEEKSVYADAHTLAEIKNDYGLVFQNFNLFPHMTVLKNLTSAPVTVQKREAGEVEKQARQLLERVGLADKADAYPGSLSGGQQQRVSIGRALINNPAIMLADEPTGNLDSANSKEIMSLLEGFNKEFNQTVIMITHDETIARTADRVISVVDGHIVGNEVMGE